MASLPLEGVRVMANTYTWAGPYAGMVLADLGAEVILIESIQRWQWNTRGFMARPSKALVETLGSIGGAYPNKDPGERPWNRHAMFNSAARNKHSFTVDLMKPEGVEIVRRLASISDVLIENSTPGVMDKLGVGYDDLRKVKPDLVMVSSSGMGARGPYAGHRGFGTQMEDLSGFTWLRAYPDGEPSETPMTNHSDASAGAGIALAVLYGLQHRNRTGQGQWIDCSQSEKLIGQVGDVVMDYTMNGRVEGTLGNRHRSMAPHGAYKCAGNDRWIAIAIENDRQWEALKGLMGSPAWANDQKFRTSLGRWKNQDELDKGITEWTKTKIHSELFLTCQAAGVPAAALCDEAEISRDPQLLARDFFVPINNPEAGTHLHIGPLWQSSSVKFAVRKPDVRLGEDNAYVYKDVLGVSNDTYVRLEREGHIGMDYVPGVT